MKKYTTLALSICLIAFSVPFAQAQVNLNNGLMVYLPFTGNANDASGNGNNGTVTGATLRADRGNTPNASYEFDGVGNFIRVPNSPSFNFAGNAQTISFWFQLCQIPGPTDDKEYYIMSKMTAATSSGWHIFMRRDVAFGGALRIYYRGLLNGNHSAQNILSCDISSIEVGTWHRVTFVLGINDNGIKMSSKLDNSWQAWRTGQLATIASNNLDFIIGGGTHIWSAGDRMFGKGRIDDIRIYDRAINDQEIDALHNLITPTAFNPTITVSNNNGLCLNNDSLILTASTHPGLSYSWAGPGSTTYSTNPVVIRNPTAANSGTYTMTANYEGCPRAPITTTVTPPLPRLTLTGPTQICENAPFTYSVPNNPAATYTWTVPGGGTPAGNTFSATAAAMADSGKYSLSYAQGGCIGISDTIRLAVVREYRTTAYDTICQGQSILLAGAQQTTAGAYPDTYQSVTGCDSIVTTQLFVKPLPQVSLGPDQQSCVGSTVTLNAVTDGTLVTWNTAQTTPSINVNSTGDYWFEATLNGCTARDTVHVNFFLNPAATFTANDLTQCLTGNSYAFSPVNNFAPGSTFNWSFTGALTSTSTANNPTGIVWDADGSYNVTLVVTENNCVSTPSILTVTVYPQPVADFTAVPRQGCEPVNIKFNNTSQSQVGYTAAWVLGDGSNATELSPAHTYQQDGFYNVTLTVTDANGCVDTESKPGFITVYPQPVAGFTIENTDLNTTDSQLQVNDASSQSSACYYYLTDGSASWTDCSFSANIPGTGTFTVTQVVTSGAGCVDSMSQQFTVRPQPEIFIPNTFTPNGDFLNERFEPSLSWIGDFYLTVFDRWGGIVFETDDPFTYWNGRLFNYGKELPQDIYAYRIRYQPYLQKKDHFLTGSVTLVR